VRETGPRGPKIANSTRRRSPPRPATTYTTTNRSPEPRPNSRSAASNLGCPDTAALESPRDSPPWPGRSASHDPPPRHRPPSDETNRSTTTVVARAVIGWSGSPSWSSFGAHTRRKRTGVRPLRAWARSRRASKFGCVPGAYHASPGACERGGVATRATAPSGRLNRVRGAQALGTRADCPVASGYDASPHRSDACPWGTVTIE
jgi:hypothetical protein